MTALFVAAGVLLGSFSLLPEVASAAGVATQLAFTPQVSNSTVGATFSVTVAVEDANGNLVTSDETDQVTLTISSGPGTLTCTTNPVTVFNGDANFSCSIDQAGSYTLLASSASLSSANSSSFTVALTATVTVPGQVQIINVSENGQYILYAGGPSYGSDNPDPTGSVYWLDTVTGVDLLIGNSGPSVMIMSGDGQHVFFNEACGGNPGDCGDLLGGMLQSGWYEWNANGDTTASYDLIAPYNGVDGSYAQPAISYDGSVVAFGVAGVKNTYVLNVTTGVSMLLPYAGPLVMTADGSILLVQVQYTTEWDFYEYSAVTGTLIETIPNPNYDSIVSISNGGDFAVGFGGAGSVYNNVGYVYINLATDTVQAIPNAYVPLSCLPLPGEITLSSDGQTVGFGAYSNGTGLTQSGPYNGYFSYNPSTGQVAMINTSSVGPSDLNGAGGICPSLGLSGDGLTAYLVAYFPSGSTSSGATASDLNSNSRVQPSADVTASSPVSEIYQVSMPSGSGVTQAITFSAPASGLVGGSATLSATGGASGNPVVYSIDSTSGAGVCNVSGTDGMTLDYTGAGNCVIDANQAGNSTYAAAPQVIGSTTVRTGTKSQKINFGPLANKTLAQSPVSVSATSSSGLTVTFTTTTSTVCTAGGTNGATITLLTVGTCTLQASQAGSATYAAATAVNRSFTVSQASQKINFGKLASKTLAQSPVSVSATSSSGLTVTFTTTTPTVCTAGGTNGATIPLLTAGKCTVQASQAGNATFNAATAVSQSFTVSKK
jgi:hypothetical protein